MATRQLPGVFCIEGEWEDSMESRQSVEPALDALARIKYIRFIRRTANTREELDQYLSRWFERRLNAYEVGFLGFHGTPRTLYLGNIELTLSDLTGLIDGRACGKVLYFGSCKVMAAKEEELQQFCQETGAKAIAGYTTDVDWLESSAFELLLLADLAHSDRMKPAYDRMVRKYPDFTRRLGFRMSHSTWTSPR